VQLERPALNPTSNVKANKPPPLGGLSYEKDPSRPGGGVFIVHGKAKGAFLKAGPGVIIQGQSDEEDEDDAPSAGAHDHESGTLSAPAQDGNANVNPVLNEGGMAESENVHVMNVLDSSPSTTRALERFALADNNWLDGIPGPGGMFDWGQWDEFFSRIGNAPSNGQTLGANVLSASQPGAPPVEITTNERTRESPEKGGFPMQAQTGS